MKQLLLYILLLCACIFLKNMQGSQSVPEKAAVSAEISAEKGCTEYLLAFVAENNVADLSLQQSNPFSNVNTFRRNLQTRILPEKAFFRLADEGSLTRSFHTLIYYYREYYARQKMSGYYLYTLCKIII